MNAFLGALMFLTRLPVGRWYHHRPESASRSVGYFPLVGALVGGWGGLLVLSGQLLLPSFLTVLIAMVGMVFLTGGLHEDGLVDAADGLMGGREIQERLEIMKDSRLGSYGAMALWFTLTAKFFLLQALLSWSLSLLVGSIIAANTLGRMATVLLLCSCRYVRSENSKAGPFGNSVGVNTCLFAFPFTLGIIFLALGLKALLCLGLAFGVTLVVRFYFMRKLGGITGDCLGACHQLVELSCYVVLLIPLSRN